MARTDVQFVIDNEEIPMVEQYTWGVLWMNIWS